MPDIDLSFARSEYLERLHKTRRAMDRAGIEILFTCDPSNMAWLTGYDGWSFYVHQGVLIGPEGGFSEGEREEAIRLGARPVSLGGRNLSASTAALVACTLAARTGPAT